MAKALRLKPVHSPDRIWTGIYESHELKLMITGPGKDNVKNAFSEIFQSPVPETVVSYGFAGALSPALEKGDVLIANRVLLNNHENSIFQIPLKKNSIVFEDSFHVHEGTLLSTLDIVAVPEEKAFLGRRYDALAVDTESGYLCEEVLKRKLKFFAVRGITDMVHESLPAVVQKWVGPDGKILKKTVISDIFRNPGAIFPLLRLGFASRKANRRMIQSFKRFLEIIQ